MKARAGFVQVKSLDEKYCFRSMNDFFIVFFNAESIFPRGVYGQGELKNG